jgi:hypothetical protein
MGDMAGLYGKELAMILLSAMPSLMAAMASVADPRDPRGVRHPFAALLGLTLVALAPAT